MAFKDKVLIMRDLVSAIVNEARVNQIVEFGLNILM